MKLKEKFMLNEQLQVLDLAIECQYDWNKPETAELIKPHLDTLNQLIRNLEKIQINPFVIELFCRAGAYYLHDLRQPDNAKIFLYSMVRYVDKDKNPDLWQELNNHLAFYHQQMAFRFNNQKKIEEANKELLQSNEFCLKMYNAVVSQPQKFDKLKFAFTHCILALNSGEEKNYHDAHGHYEDAFIIYDELVPANEVDNQSLRAKARDAQFLLELGYYHKALDQFEMVIKRWELLEAKALLVHPYAFRAYLAYAKSLKILAQKGFQIDLKKATQYALRAFTIQRSQLNNENHVALTEAITISSELMRIDSKFLTKKLVDEVKEENSLDNNSLSSPQELLAKLGKFNRDSLNGSAAAQFYDLIKEAKIAVQKCYENDDLVNSFKLFKQLGIVHTHAAKFESGIFYFKAALTIKTNDKKNQISDEMLSDVYQTLGTNLVRLERFKEGYKYAIEAQKLREPLKETFEFPKGYNAFWHTTLSLSGNIVYGLNDFTSEEKEKCETSIRKVITEFEGVQPKIVESLIQLKDRMQIVKKDISELNDYIEKCEPDFKDIHKNTLEDKKKELDLCEARLLLHEQTPIKNYLPFQIGEAYLMLGVFYLEKAVKTKSSSDMDQANENLTKANSIYTEKFTDKTRPIDYSRLLNKMAFYSLLNGDYKSAQFKFEKAIEFVNLGKLPTHHICESYLGLQLVHEKLNDPQAVEKYAKKYADSRQDIYGEYVENGPLETYMRGCFMNMSHSNENVNQHNVMDMKLIK